MPDFKVKIHKPIEEFTEDEKESLKDTLIKMQIIKGAYHTHLSKQERKGKTLQEQQELRFKKFEEYVKNENM